MLSHHWPADLARARNDALDLSHALAGLLGEPPAPYGGLAYFYLRWASLPPEALLNLLSCLEEVAGVRRDGPADLGPFSASNAADLTLMVCWEFYGCVRALAPEFARACEALSPEGLPDWFAVRRACAEAAVELAGVEGAGAALEQIRHALADCDLQRHCAEVAWEFDVAARDRRLPESAAPAPLPPPDYVTLDMMAVLLKYSKKTLERKKNRKNNPLPPPAIEGGGGKADEWVWAEIRPWLEKEFGRILPERFPSLVPPT